MHQGLIHKPEAGGTRIRCAGVALATLALATHAARPEDLHTEQQCIVVIRMCGTSYVWSVVLLCAFSGVAYIANHFRYCMYDSNADPPHSSPQTPDTIAASSRPPNEPNESLYEPPP